MSMKKLAMELAKGAIKTYTAYPAPIILGYLIDLVAVQENATRSALERIEGMVNDLQENPFKVGKYYLVNAKNIKDSKLKKDRIIKALDAFSVASQWSHIRNVLIPINAQFYVGVCYDLLSEPDAALQTYEDVFKEAKRFEMMIPNDYSQDKSFWDKVEVVIEFFEFPGDTIADWFDRRGKDNKAKQHLLDFLASNKRSLNTLVENLLTIITSRKGVSKQEYLAPYFPKKKKKPKNKILPASSFSSGKPILFQPGRKPVRPLSSAGSSRFVYKPSFLLCPKCNSTKTLRQCPDCSGIGTKSLTGSRYIRSSGIKCTRCNGLGKALVCRCPPTTTSLFNVSGNFAKKTCLVCGGKGTTTYGLTKCSACGGSGFSWGR